MGKDLILGSKDLISSTRSMMQSGLNSWNSKRYPGIFIECCFYHFFLLTTDMWTSISTRVQTATPGLVVLVSLTNARARWF